MTPTRADTLAPRGRRRTVIRPTSGWAWPRLGEAWQHRQLLLFLAWRDLKVRYAQTALGVVWTVFQPVALMGVFTLAFRRIGDVETAGVPYPVFVLAGLVFWTFFARALVQGGDSLVANVSLVTKTPCPRLLIPLASVVSALVDLTVALTFFLVFATLYGEPPGWELLALPAALALGVLVLLGPLLLFSALNVSYRDVRQVLPFLVQLLLFLAPVAYPLDTLGGRLEDVLALNPLVGVVETFRWALVGTAGPSALELASSILVGIAFLAAGLQYFARTERTFADRA